ncbi:LysR family transcriptional regulator [Blastopirellula marina]|uniref:LysR family transcriptional regulator n=1 Tax=Blastopirellula marina TaxID=124 RepID=A0A2S8FNE1_9BACT|nr:LysR family transcriptional regulator [Blastopirellula marina]PQO33677.1 LysR family transcriptional regulator [Blastopirellula marina]PTL43464.1 LysR family transcriptional regulator [Blastopirellula marina]
MLDNFKAFVAAAEQGSFTNAANSMGMTISTMSRRVQELEAHLGAELFHRSSQGLTLTITGRTYYQECAAFINELSTRIDDLQKSITSMEGSLTVAMPTNLGSGPLDEFWQSFASRNPQILLRVHLVDPLDDISSLPIDIGLQSGSRRNSHLIQERIGTITPVLVASSSFSGDIPSDIEALRQSASVAADLFGEWILSNGERQEVIPKQHVHTSNDMKVILSLVKAGAGIALLPLSIVQREIENGNLKRILLPWSGLPREIFFIRPYQRTPSVRAKRFEEELLMFLSEQPWFQLHEK